jgi:uncharacterized protein YgiM (DUF1202 family)
VRTGARTAPARPRSPWPGGLLALALLLILATFAVLRSATSPRAESAAAPTALATAAPVTESPAATPATDLPPTLPRAATVTAQDGLYLRSDHTSSAGSIGMLASGTHVTIIGAPVQADGYTWWNVEVNGQHGWCAGEFLTFDTT